MSAPRDPAGRSLPRASSSKCPSWTWSGIAARNFRNLRHPEIAEPDSLGPRAMVDNWSKLVLHDHKESEPKVDLFDLHDDPGETRDLSAERAEVVRTLKRPMRDWQASS